MNILFFKDFRNLKALISNSIVDKDWLLIRIEDYKEVQGTFSRFYENELLAIDFFNKIVQKIKFLNKIFKWLVNFKSPSGFSSNYYEIKKLVNLNIKNLTDYIVPEIYEESDKLSVDLFNKVKELSFIKENFQFDEINLYETNRLEIVNEFYYIFLSFFSILKIIKKENPEKIIISSTINKINRFLIKSIAIKSNIPIKVIRFHKQDKLYLKKVKLKLRLLIEHIWLWQIWPFLAKKYVTPVRHMSKNKTNFILCHYKNFFSSLFEVINQLDRTDTLQNILYVPHKLLQQAKQESKRYSLKNMKILPIVDKNYQLFVERYKNLDTLLKEVVRSNFFKNISYSSIEFSKLIKLAFLNLYEKFINSLRFLENLKCSILNIKPDIICMLSGNDAFDILATRMLKQLNIPTFFFPHALISIRRDYTFLEQDYIICSGERDKEYYSSLGTPENKMSILGIPLFDKLFRKFQGIKKSSNIREKLINVLNLDKNKKIILLVTTHDEDYIRRKVFNSVINSVKEVQNCQLVVKIHPVEDISFYHNLIEDSIENRPIILKDFDLHDIIMASDLVIGRCTGAQIEALLLEKKVIDLIYESTFGRYLMEKYNAVIPVYHPKDLVKAIEMALYDKEINNKLKKGRETYLKFTLYKFDGEAAVRIVNFLKNKIGF